MTMNVMETVRKMMGWCPNAGALTRRKSVQFDNLTVNAPGSGGELTHPNAWWVEQVSQQGLNTVYWCYSTCSLLWNKQHRHFSGRTFYRDIGWGVNMGSRIAVT